MSLIIRTYESESILVLWLIELSTVGKDNYIYLKFSQDHKVVIKF